MTEHLIECTYRFSANEADYNSGGHVDDITIPFTMWPPVYMSIPARTHAHGNVSIADMAQTNSGTAIVSLMHMY